MTSCPICQKPVDPLRASHIRVVAGRVVTYCSAACRDADTVRASGPLSVPTAAASTAIAAGPISAALQAAVPASSGKPGAASAAAPASAPATSKPPAIAEPAKDAAKDAAKDGKAAGKAGAKPEEPARAGEPTALTSEKGGDKPAKADDKGARPDDKGARPDDKPDGKASKADGKASKADGKASKADPKAPRGDEKPGDKPNGKAARPAEPSTSKATADGKPGSSPAGSGPSKNATAVEPSATSVRSADQARDVLLAPAPRRTGRLLVIALIVLAIGGAVLWKLASSDEPAPPPPPPKAIEAPRPAPPPPPPTFVPAEAHQRAVEVLRSQLTVESLRVRRFAAAALGRLGDPQAVETLLALLPTEQMEIARLDIAYGLARAGNQQGLEMLVTGLRSSRRDVKGDAARLLAALKDARAESTLSSLLVLSQFRLGAAEQLARLGNKQAIALLQKLRDDDKAPEEDRLRATIALGYAGQAEVAEALRALLPDARFNVGAAGALAVLHDASARSTLVEQLSIPSLRVSAALALRRLEPELDASKLLYRVMPDLESSKDTERVVAAEAVLLLTGPATLAERD
jgi:HEAT repeat protein